MHVITAASVPDALYQGLGHLLNHGRLEPSRAGPVRVAPEPVCTVYLDPRRRVLFSPVRDANPFFHLAEAVWMLTGGDDAGFLNAYVRDFGERFAEPPEYYHIHDAYGWRWRTALGYDQLDHIVELLRRDPSTRQAVLQMWDGTAEGEDDQQGEWRTRPCNTHCYFRVRPAEPGPVLDMTLLCRSNDIIWGAYGANAVHFSVLHEYVAALVGAGLGRLYQVSNNFHAYESEILRVSARSPLDLPRALLDDHYELSGEVDGEALQPVVADPTSFDRELVELVRRVREVQAGEANPVWSGVYNPWLGETVYTALTAHRLYRQGHLAAAVERAEQIAAPDWRLACSEWIERRAAPRKEAVS